MSALAGFRFFVVPHTHWDREWYLPLEHFRLELAALVDEVLDTLERDESFRSFTLDGQAVVLEDYLELRPEQEGDYALSSLPDGSSSARATSCRTSCSSAVSRSCGTCSSDEPSASGSALDLRRRATCLTASATRRSCPKCSPASASRASSSRAVSGTRSSGSAVCSAGGRRTGAR